MANEKVNGIAVEAVRKFAKKKAKYEEITRKYEKYKEEFEALMWEQFGDTLNGRKKLVVNDGDKTITVTRVEKMTVTWLTDKLKQCLPPGVFSKCVRKKYEIYDMPGLTRYLKACRVDPKIFRNFLLITETPDPELIDEASYRGLLSVNEINGCYVVNKSKPYYRVMIKEGNPMDEGGDKRQ